MGDWNRLRYDQFGNRRSLPGSGGQGPRLGSVGSGHLPAHMPLPQPQPPLHGGGQRPSLSQPSFSHPPYPLPHQPPSLQPSYAGPLQPPSAVPGSHPLYPSPAVQPIGGHPPSISQPPFQEPRPSQAFLAQPSYGSLQAGDWGRREVQPSPPLVEMPQRSPPAHDPPLVPRTKLALLTALTGLLQEELNAESGQGPPGSQGQDLDAILQLVSSGPTPQPTFAPPAAIHAPSLGYGTPHTPGGSTHGYGAPRPPTPPPFQHKQEPISQSTHSIFYGAGQPPNPQGFSMQQQPTQGPQMNFPHHSENVSRIDSFNPMAASEEKYGGQQSMRQSIAGPEQDKSMDTPSRRFLQRRKPEVEERSRYAPALDSTEEALMHYKRLEQKYPVQTSGSSSTGEDWRGEREWSGRRDRARPQLRDLRDVRRTISTSGAGRTYPSKQSDSSKRRRLGRSGARVEMGAGRNIMPRMMRFERASEKKPYSESSHSESEGEEGTGLLSKTRDRRILIQRPRKPAPVGTDPEHPLTLDSDDEGEVAVVEVDSESDGEAVGEVLKALDLRVPGKEEVRGYSRPFSSRAPALCVYVAALYPSPQGIVKNQEIDSSFAVQFRGWAKEDSGMEIPLHDRPQDFALNHKIQWEHRHIPQEMFGILEALRGIIDAGGHEANIQFFVKAMTVKLFWRDFILSLSKAERRHEHIPKGTAQLNPLEAILALLRENELEMDVDVPRLDSQPMWQTQARVRRWWEQGKAGVGVVLWRGPNWETRVCGSDWRKGEAVEVYIAGLASDDGRSAAVAVGFASVDALKDAPYQQYIPALRKTFATKLTVRMLDQGPVEWIGLKEARNRIGRVGQNNIKVQVFTTGPEFAFNWQSSWYWAEEEKDKSECRWVRDLAATRREPHKWHLRLTFLPHRMPEDNCPEATRMKEIYKLAKEVLLK